MTKASRGSSSTYYSQCSVAGTSLIIVLCNYVLGSPESTNGLFQTVKAVFFLNQYLLIYYCANMSAVQTVYKGVGSSVRHYAFSPKILLFLYKEAIKELLKLKPSFVEKHIHR